MKINIHTLKWRDDIAVTDADAGDGDATSNILCVAELDGKRYDNVVATKVEQSSDFTEVWVCFVADVSVQSHTLEEWEYRFGKLAAPMRAKPAKNGTDELVGVAEVSLVPAGSFIVSDEYHGGIVRPLIEPVVETRLGGASKPLLPSIGDDIESLTGDDPNAPGNS